MQKIRAYLEDNYFLLPAISSLLLALSRYPIKLNFLSFIAFIPLLHLISKVKRQSISVPCKKIVKAGVVFSSVYVLVALHWIGVVTLPGLLGIFILYSFYFSILFLVIFKVSFAFPKLDFVIFISAWLSFEWLQNYGELRFPWFNVGYSLADYLFMIQVAEYGGIFLLSLLILIVNVLLFTGLKSFPSKRSVSFFVITGAMITIWVASGFYRYKTIPIQKESVKAAIVQVSIPQYLKWSDAFYDSTLTLYSQYVEKAAETSPDLILLPESAIPEYVLRSDRAHSFVRRLVRKSGADILLGLPHYEVVWDNDEHEVKYFNAATVFEKGGGVAPLYIKNYLVPVGERIPFMDYIKLFKKLDFGQANWEYGKEPVFYSLYKDDKTFIYSPTICFEIAFPNLIRKIADEGADFIVNITNDAWFKKTIGPYQHGMMTVIRAVETRTQFYRAANTGISMIVTPRGEITQKTALFEKCAIEDELYVYPYDTVYVKVAKNYPVIFLVITICLTILTFISCLSVKG